MRFGFAGDEDGVVGVHHDEIADADGSDGGSVLGAGVEDDIAGSVDVDELAGDAITGVVGFDVAGERVPGSEIVPCEGAIGDGDVAGVLHECVVDGDLFDLGIFAGEHAGEFGGIGGCGGPPFEGGEHFGLMGAKAVGHGFDGPDEHAGVPAILTTFEVGLSFFERRFFDELEHVMERGFGGLGTSGSGEWFADVNISVAGGGFGGLDADSDDGLIAMGDVESVLENELELFFVGDDVVGWEDGHDTLFGASTDEGCAEGDGGAGIAAARFGDDVTFGKLRELSADGCGLDLIGDDDHVFGRDDGEHAIDGLLEEGSGAEQGDELFWGAFTADGPEPFPATAGHDDDEAILGGEARGAFFGSRHDGAGFGVRAIRVVEQGRLDSGGGD